tara:strand:- start:397 stop:588 length:192 start_codon:yes stop_codon:yes gene_type:complete
MKYTILNHETGLFEVVDTRRKAELIVKETVERGADLENLTVIWGLELTVLTIPREEYDYKIRD